MEVYYFTLMILMLFSFFELRIKNHSQLLLLQKLYWLPLLLLILQVGFRWEMATDWEAYYIIFQESTEKFYDIPMEKGFLLINFIFSKFFKSYQFFLLVQAFLLYFYVFKFFKTLTPYPIIALIWFYCINLGIVGSSRQLVAITIILIGLLLYFKNKKWYWYLLFVFLAMQFHTSSFFGILYLFFDRKISNKIILISIILSLVIGALGASSFILSYTSLLGEVAQNKTEAYSNEITTFSVTAIIKRLVIVLPMLYFRSKLEHSNKYLNIIINAYVFGICVYLLFGKTFGIVATRGAFYFNIMEPIIITYYFLFIKNIIVKHIFVIILTFASIYLLKQSITQYPDIYVPYKTQFFETDLIKY